MISKFIRVNWPSSEIVIKINVRKKGGRALLGLDDFQSRGPCHARSAKINFILDEAVFRRDNLTYVISVDSALNGFAVEVIGV